LNRPGGNPEVLKIAKECSWVPMSVDVLAMQDVPKTNRLCVDPSASMHATYDRSKCSNIRACKVVVSCPALPGLETSFVCTEVGDLSCSFLNDDGTSVNFTLVNVLIHNAFPYHIVSERAALKNRPKGRSVTKSSNSWCWTNGSLSLFASKHDPCAEMEIHRVELRPIPVT